MLGAAIAARAMAAASARLLATEQIGPRPSGVSSSGPTGRHAGQVPKLNRRRGRRGPDTGRIDPMSFYLKDPQSRIDYELDWGAGYLDGQTIVASAWAVTPVEEDGLTVESDSFGLMRSAVRIAGGVAGHVYSLTNRVTLSDGSIDERSISLRVEQR
jgi:hypothetical protein